MSFDESKHPRDNDGKFTNGNGEISSLPSANRLVNRYENRFGKIKLTPAQKIASVKIDFNQDNFLPELNENALEQIGANSNKPVLLKKSVIDRNSKVHDDLTPEDFTNILANALYGDKTEIFSANENKPYFNFVAEIEVTSKGKPKKGVAMIDIDEKKDNFEIVHIHFLRERSYKALKKKVK